ncbi:MAG: exodeoxyribonuclease VII large subunit, partial [Coprococcus sp.]
YTVKELNERIQELVSGESWLGSLGVEGEITGLGTDKRGHMYFSLKDPSGVLAAVMFAGKQVYGLKFAPKNGDKVHAFGHIDVFVRDGKYQLYVDRLVRVGDGEVNAKLERLIARLDGMGLLQEYKKYSRLTEAYWHSDGGAKVISDIRGGKTEDPAARLLSQTAGTVCGGGDIQRNRDTDHGA